MKKHTMTVTTEHKRGKTVETFEVTADKVEDKRDRVRFEAPYGSTQTITVK